MNLKQRFETYLKQHVLLDNNSILILAVSGGSDSMVLADLCKNTGYEIVLAHANFQLRGAESNRDQLFVESYAKEKHLRLFVEIFDTVKFAQQHSLGIQEAARSLRYTWLNSLADKLYMETGRPTYILTAHHADDQIETLLIHFFRGTGLKGLTGIPEKNGRIIRPLLGFSKNELLLFLSENKIQFVEDSSNLSSDYTRNFFRNEIIPAIENVYPSVKENLMDNIRRFKSTASLYKETLTPLLSKLLVQKGNEKQISIAALMKYKNDTLIYELIHPYGFREGHIEELKKLSTAVSGSFIEAAITHYRIIKHRNHFIIAPPAPTESGIVLIAESDKDVTYESGKLHLEMKSEKPISLSADSNIALLDAKEIIFPLILRKWQSGDYFYPLGMRKKKKIARFLIDMKLSKSQKEKIMVLECNKRILWVVGYRIDDRFKITNASKKILEIKYRMSNLSDEMM